MGGGHGDLNSEKHLKNITGCETRNTLFKHKNEKKKN